MYKIINIEKVDKGYNLVIEENKTKDFRNKVLSLIFKRKLTIKDKEQIQNLVKSYPQVY